MKKPLILLITFMCMISMVSPVAATGQVEFKQDNEPPPSQPTELSSQIFLPTVFKTPEYYTVSGQVKNENDEPLSEVVITSDSGQTTNTDENGVYSMQVWDGERQITASKPGYEFDPSPAWIKLDQNIYSVNFSSGSACTTPIPNPSFEIVPLYWNPISGSANGYTPYYSTAKAHTGTVSGFTGIKDTWPNKISWSRWRSQEISIPTSAISATLSLYMWPKTTETVILAPEMENPFPKGFNMDSATLPEASDVQYMALITPLNQYITTTFSVRRNDQAWLYSGNIDLMAWKGKTVKLEFGTYNDGLDGVTSAYFDDITVEICKPDGTITGCSNILVNSNFESSTGWTISPAPKPSAYDTHFYYSPFHSMRSGIPLGVPYPAPGQWRIAEFYQNVTIPSNATYARLSVRLLPRSSDLWGYHIEEQAAMEALDEVSAPDRVVSQYGHIRNSTNTATLRQLFKWFPIHSWYWLYREYNLLDSRYPDIRGQTVGILFGVMDDGYWGNTVLYVDNARLYVCVP